MCRRMAGVLLAVGLTACGGSSTDGQMPSDAASTGGALADSGSGGAASTGGTGGVGVCLLPCSAERECCVDHCVNLQNDPQNCGVCGRICQTGTYCTGGQCVTPPCNTACGTGGVCCANSCCGAGELCCDPQGPIDTTPVCTLPTNGTCPMGCAPLCICASPDTLIATPQGERSIASLGVGDLVYTVDAGMMTTAPIVRTNRTPVARHSVTRIALATGSVLEISGLHPTADGRTFGSLRAGQLLDGVEIRSTTVIPYAHDATYDILPESDSGAYFAGGVLVGSTLASHPAHVARPTTPSTSR